MSLQISERLNATDINGVKADYRSYAKTFTEQGFTPMSWTEWLIAHLKGGNCNGKVYGYSLYVEPGWLWVWCC